MSIEYFEVVSGTISKIVANHMPEIKWVLKSNLFTHVVEKHVIESTNTTRVLAELKQEEDTSSALVTQSVKGGA